jgi:hypothetical protein
MPVEFLSDDQAAAYERFAGDVSRCELEGFFLLDGTALDLIANKRGDHNRLGVGLQVGTVRYLGHFLTEDGPDKTATRSAGIQRGQLARSGLEGRRITGSSLWPSSGRLT